MSSNTGPIPLPTTQKSEVCYRMGPRLPSKASNLRAKAYGIDTGWAMGEGDRLESLEWYQEMLMAKVCPRILA